MEASQIGGSSEQGLQARQMPLESPWLTLFMHSRQQQVGRSEGNGVREDVSPLRRPFQVPPAFNVSSLSLVAFPTTSKYSNFR